MKGSVTFKFIVFFTVIFGFFVHGYRFFNLNLTHDSLGILFPKDASYFMSSIGRFLYHIFYLFFQIYPEPFFMGIISLFMIGLGCYCIVRVLALNKTICGLLLSSIMIVSVPFTLFSATYIGSLPVFSLSFFFSSLSVYLLIEFNKKNFVFAIILLALAMGGEDQSIIQFATALLMLVLIKKILDGERDIFRNILLYSCYLFFSGLFYLVLYRLNLIILQLPPATGYNSLEHIRIDRIFNNITNINFLKEAYLLPINFFISKNEQSGGVLYPLSKVFKISAILIYLFCLIYPITLIIKKKIEKRSFFQYFVVIVLSPFAVNSVYFISNGLMHDLMKLSYYYIFILGIMFLDRMCKNDWSLFNISGVKDFVHKFDRCCIILIPFFLIILISLFFAKNVYFVKELQFNYVTQTVNRLLINIENTPGYIPNETKVIFIGQLDRNNNCNSSLYLLPNQTGLRGAVSYDAPLVGYIFKYLGYKFNYIKNIDSTSLKTNLDNILGWHLSKEDVDFIMYSPIFPQRGYIFFINDILFVKLSN